MMEGRLTGQILAGKYKVLDLLVDCPYELYNIEYEGHRNDLFLRTYRKNADKAQNLNMLQEPLFLKQLDHPAFPRIVRITEDDLYYYVIREIINGRTLNSMLSEEQLSEEMIMNYSLQICEAVRYLSSEAFCFVFGLVTPSYIYVQPDNSLKFVGMDHWLGFPEGFRFQALEDRFRAPETFFKGANDITSVIYTIGQVIHIMTDRLVQQNPLFAGSPNYKKLSGIITKCMHKDSKKRYQSCDALISALKRPFHRSLASQLKEGVLKMKKTKCKNGHFFDFDKFTYCPICGSDSEKNEDLKLNKTPMYCLHCGYKLESNYHFCPNCGKKIESHPSNFDVPPMPPPECHVWFQCPKCGMRFERHGTYIHEIKFGTCRRCGYSEE